MTRFAPLALVLSLLFTGCGGDVELPPAEPLSADPAVIGALHGAAAGPHEALRADTELEAPGLRTLPVTAHFPAHGSDYPLLIFSHGNWSDRHSYDAVLTHWVSHGYVVLATDHLDCCSPVKGIVNSLRHGQYGLVDARVEDVRRLLDGLPELESRIPALAGKADTSRLALTGHSFGAFTAQQFGGAAALDPDSGEYRGAADERVRAIVALSPPRPMFDTITADSWKRLRTPTLVSTGTWDIQPGFFDDWRDHLMSYDTGVAGDLYALVIDGADHYLGNLICRTGREAEPQRDALSMVHIASTAFLDHYLKGDAAAGALIRGNQLQEVTDGFATLGRR